MEYAVTATWNMPTVVDNSGENSTVTCNQDSPSQFSIGYTIVSCIAVDAVGNEAMCSFAIYVKGENELRTESN